ncbi:polysaccharide biosynthesis protein [Polynucleobacter sp. MWH-UH24A]|uniref:polysaccharide biosynthesis protein n=1 Tax=Polynucleobacter sp. MWH-UH24A TaxID=2689110 RepID=UPI001BFEB98E|nr:nucleoside-diphosphate sugar epimerase/dehydratase [Polynucleobacter sp. MWH-UH24A]QWD76443.1 polysaccharide biosynthesis protein [Polynucleobacter sp. MWH-UH24A]
MFNNIFKHFLLNLPRLVKRTLVVFLDFIICGLSVWLAFGLREDNWGYFQGHQWIVFLVVIGLAFPLFISFELYRAIFRYIGTVAFISIIRVFIIYAGLFFGIFTLYGVDGVPRSIGIIQPMLLFFGVGITRYLVRYWLSDSRNFQDSNQRAQSIGLIYGAGSAGRQLASVLTNNKEFLIKGFIDDDVHLQGRSINGITVYRNSNLQDLIRRLGITDVFLAIPSVSQDRRREIIASLNGFSVRVRTLPSLIDLASGRVRISDLHDLDMNDLLGRVAVNPDIELLEKNIRGQVILVTGAGGSIGSELCRQIINFSPKTIVLLDSSEHSLYLIYEELKRKLTSLKNDLSNENSNESAVLDLTSLPRLEPCLASVRDSNLLLNIFKTYQPFIVFHAAAYKHVTLVEDNPSEGIRNNVFGTLACAQASLECGVPNFVLVSTDKAVRPTNIMGASKRIAELVLQAMQNCAPIDGHKTKFSMVRFGNVLGSSGSVAPLFNAQIAAGGPVTLTHPDVTRYFMTIPEAAQLVIQASSMATGGDVFVLDMGEPVRIYDLAVNMIYLSGHLVKDESHPQGNIEIKVIGLRPGEKLYEELLIGDNPQPTAHPKIMKAHEDFLPWDELQQELERLKLALDSSDSELIRDMLKKLVPGYKPNPDTERLNEKGNNQNYEYAT